MSAGARLIAYADGSGSYAGSDAGIGACLFIDGVCVAECSEYIGLGTNNLAELRAIRRALWLVETEATAQWGEIAIVRSDSQWSIDSITRAGVHGDSYRGAHERLIYAIADQIALSPAAVRLEWVRGHDGEPGNELADWLAGDAVWRYRESLWMRQTRGRRRRPDDPKSRRCPAA